MQPLCRCLALHQDPLVEAHCMQLCHGLLPHALLRVLHVQMCLDQQPTLVCAQMGVTHGGSNPGPLQGQYHARGVVCNESCLHKHAHCPCLANMLPTHHVHILRHLQGGTVVPTTHVEHPMSNALMGGHCKQFATKQQHRALAKVGPFWPIHVGQ